MLLQEPLPLWSQCPADASTAQYGDELLKQDYIMLLGFFILWKRFAPGLYVNAH